MNPFVPGQISASLPIIVLAAVFLLTAARQVGRWNLKIWQIMLGGAVVVLASGQISVSDALGSINTDVMLFLGGMFIVGEGLVESGYLSYLSHRLFSRAETPERVLFFILFGMGLFSAVLMNDTLAIIGTPVVLSLAARHRLSPRLMLTSLAVAITTGSVMSPIGNPQNLLVAVNAGIGTPFITFGRYLLVPTLLSLGCAFLVLRWWFRAEFSTRSVDPGPPTEVKTSDTLPARISLAVILILVSANIVSTAAGERFLVPLPLIALCAAAPVLLASPAPARLVRQIDWPTLIFFASMFVLMASVWQTGLFQALVGDHTNMSVFSILLAGTVISQFISNVPFVTLFQPVLLQAGATTAALMALAAGSTIAGNLTILGAASNVIIIQHAERQGATISFIEFAAVGVPLTLLQLGIYWAWLAFVPF